MINDQTQIVVFDQAGSILANLDPPIGDPEMVFLALSPDGRTLAIESDYVDQFLKLFDIQKQEYINLPQYNARQIKFSQDNQFLYIYEEEKSWEGPKLKVLSAPDWQKVDQSAAMTEYEATDQAFASYPTIFYPKSDFGEHLGGFFKITKRKRWAVGQFVSHSGKQRRN